MNNKEKTVKVSILLVLVVVLLASLCVAQTTTPVVPAFSKFELSAGYSYLNQNTHIDFTDGAGNFFRSFTGGLNGANLGGTFNLGSTGTFGLKADFSIWTGSGSLKTSSKQYEVAFGPVIKKHSGKFNPFGEVLIGVGHRSASGFGLSGGQNAFTGIAGAGIDFKLSQHFSIRAIEADYMWTDWHTVYPSQLLVQDWATGQNNFRVGAGLVFTF